MLKFSVGVSVSHMLVYKHFTKQNSSRIYRLLRVDLNALYVLENCSFLPSFDSSSLALYAAKYRMSQLHWKY